MLAQLVEQRTFNPLVGGSSPPRPTKNKKIKSLTLSGFFASAVGKRIRIERIHLEFQSLDHDLRQICRRLGIRGLQPFNRRHQQRAHTRVAR